jgi:copper chaperone NosL
MGLLIWLALLAGCTAQPEPLQFGTDACHVCKMTLMDNKFGGELVTRKGKVYKFDDLNCMVNFYHSGYIAPAEFSHKLVVDFNTRGQLMDATTAFFLKSDQVRSPMAGGIAAFADEAALKNAQREIGGIYLSWQEVLVQYK